MLWFFSSAHRVAQIKNLALVDFKIDINKSSTSTSNELFAGGLVGYFSGITDGGNRGAISQCYVDGEINLNVASENNYIGGIAGFRKGGSFNNVLCATDIYNKCDYGIGQKDILVAFLELIQVKRIIAFMWEALLMVVPMMDFIIHWDFLKLI